MTAPQHPLWGLYHPLRGGALAISAAIVICWILAMGAGSDMPAAQAVTIYGAVLWSSLLLIAWAVRRGTVIAHLLCMMAVPIGCILFVWHFRPGQSVPVHPFVDLLQSYVGDLSFMVNYAWDFSGVFRFTPGIIFELLNAVLMFVYVILIFVCRWLFGREADIWPSLHNDTISSSLGLAAVILTFTMVLWGLWSATDHENSVWTSLATGFPWFGLVAPLYHLSLLAQRRPRAETSQVSSARRGAPTLSTVRPIYELLTVKRSELEPDIIAHRELAAAERVPSGGSPMKDCLETLSGGGMVLKAAAKADTADAQFYRLFAKAVQQAQDRGQSVLVLCPDNAGATVHRMLSWFCRRESPAVIHRWCEIHSGKDSFSGRQFYDIILADESGFHDLVVLQGEQLRQTLHHVQLVALIDYHAIDACRLAQGLDRLWSYFSKRDLGVLVLAKDRLGLHAQLKKVFEDRTRRGPITTFEATAPSSTAYRIIWRDGPELRRKLLDVAGIRDGLNIDARVVLTAAGANDDHPAQVLAGEARGIRQDADLLNSRMHGEAALRVRQATYLAHYAPETERRVTIAEDGGNLADVVDSPYDFHGSGHDRLLHVVASPHPARDFAIDQYVHGPGEFVHDAKPFAQSIGTGLIETAARVEAAMLSPSGIDERDLAMILKQASGHLHQHLELNATRHGLLRLFRSIDPSFPESAIALETGNGRTRRFRLNRTKSMSVSSRAGVYTERREDLLGYVSLRDQGLLYAPDNLLWMGGNPHRIESIDVKAREIIVHETSIKDLPDGSASQTLFRRLYTIDFSKVASEQNGPKLIRPGFRLTRTHLYATIARRSDSYIDWPQNIPLSLGGAEPGAAERVIDQMLPFRAIYLVTLRVPAELANDLLPPMVRFTLAASLQDTLGFVMPALARRIAVADLQEGTVAGYPPRLAKLEYRYPRATTGPGGVDAAIAAAYKGGGSVDVSKEVASDWSGMNLVVMEDSNGELGAVRTAHDHWPQLLKIWHRYLIWASSQRDWQQEAGCFDAKAAATMLQLMVDGR